MKIIKSEQIVFIETFDQLDDKSDERKILIRTKQTESIQFSPLCWWLGVRNAIFLTTN
jgi:hypothetical protein